MTRSNLHIKLSNGKSLICVADSSSAPEQGYIVEQLILPLLSFNNSDEELRLLKEHCSMEDRRVNADYRYTIDLLTKEVRLFVETYNYKADTFRRGREITERYIDYVEMINNN